MAPLALWVYRAALAAVLPVAAPYLLIHARSKRRAWPPLAQRLGLRLPAIAAGGVWIQAVSVGEVAVARPLLVELRHRHPTVPLLLSSTTSTGLQLASGHHAADAVIPFPIDLPCPVRRALGAAQPRLVVLVETELWPELLAACRRRGTPVVLVNARVSDRSFRGYRAVRRLLPPLLHPLSLVLAQSELDASRLMAMGVPGERVRVVGNVKFDIAPPGAPPGIVADLRQLADGRPIWIAGSTVAGEEDAVLDAWLAQPMSARPFLLLAPRHPERASEAIAAAEARGIAVVRRTRLAEAPARCGAVVLDTIGELAALYQIADVAFVGGSLVPAGGHNPIEPARFAVPVLTGPHVRNFAAVYREFLDAGAARTVEDAGALGRAVATWLADRPAARHAGAAGRALLDRHAGATARTVDALEPFLT